MTVAIDRLISDAKGRAVATGHGTHCLIYIHPASETPSYAWHNAGFVQYRWREGKGVRETIVSEQLVSFTYDDALAALQQAGVAVRDLNAQEGE